MSEGPPTSPRPPTPHTARRLAEASAILSFDDESDFERARRGLIAQIPHGRIERTWDMSRYAFLDAREAPDTVHPGLLRQARLNAIHGLFEVTDGVWQARGYDLSNITFVAGARGWIVIDPLTTETTAAACLALANETLGARPVTTVLYTHSHVDHFGGVLGVTTREAVARGDVRVVAPEGFLREAVSENVIAGPAMRRRAIYQFGSLLWPGPRGHVDAGLGKALPLGPIDLVAPTEEISGTGVERVLDGVRVVFQNTPGTEAPAEMNFHFPDKRLLCMAENCTHTLHNLYPIRGAQMRDALGWSKYIAEAMSLFADDSDVLFASHHWPRFGKEDVTSFLTLQRDVYRWLHDQTMRLANRGLTALEIAEELELPPCFRGESHVRGYYGSVSHNAKSVYARYLGWYDGNPATLHPLPPVEAGKRYVELMGGADALLAHARKSYEKGEYRWVAQVVNHLVFADPSDTRARALQADALEQLGYQAESATWRNAYLCGARELRHGSLTTPLPDQAYFEAMTAEQIFDTLGVRFMPEVFGDARARIHVHLIDLAEDHVLGVGNAAIHHLPGQRDDSAAVSVRLDRATLGLLLRGVTSLEEAVAAGKVELIGDAASFTRLIAALDKHPGGFALVEP